MVCGLDWERGSWPRLNLRRVGLWGSNTGGEGTGGLLQAQALMPGPPQPPTEAALLGLQEALLSHGARGEPTACCTVSRDRWGLACPLAPLLSLPGLALTPKPHAEPRQRRSLCQEPPATWRELGTEAGRR